MDESTQRISFPAFAGRTFQVELYTSMKLIEQRRQPRPQKLHPKTKTLTKMNDGPATITFFCRTLSEFSWAWLFSEGALRATLGFVVERLRRIRAAHTEQHRTNYLSSFENVDDRSRAATEKKPFRWDFSGRNTFSLAAAGLF
ncbi:hypothetical protein KJ068_11250 [bacterium]|nr:hypothetical protein [bacterium]